MAARSLNRLLHLRSALVAARRGWLRIVHGVRIPESSTLSTTSRLCAGRRGSIRIGEDTLIAFKTLIFTADPVSGEDRPVSIGARCFIGGGSMVLPGVTIGDGVIVGAGAVVMEDVPSGMIIGGNPARVIRPSGPVGRWGRLPGADEASRRTWQP